MDKRYCMYCWISAIAVTVLLGGCFLDPCWISPLPGAKTRPAHCYPERRNESQTEFAKISRHSPFVCKAPPAPPTIPAETEALYAYALYHDLHILNKNYKKHDDWFSENAEKSLKEISPYLRYYHIAAANGNWKASERLLALYSIKDLRRHINREDGSYKNPKYARFLADYRQQKPVLTDYLLEASLNPDVVRSYADKGLPEAMRQLVTMGGSHDYLSPEQMNVRVKWRDAIKACYMRHGEDRSIQHIGKSNHSPQELLQMNQRIAQTGSSDALGFLAEQFNEKGNEFLFYDQKGIKQNVKLPLRLKPDMERFKRYLKMERFFYQYPFFAESISQIDLRITNDSGKYASYKVVIDDLNDIVPLPPAELPAWDGKFAFQRWYEGSPPPKPSERLMRHLANKAGLDVHTGMDKSPKAAEMVKNQ